VLRLGSIVPVDLDVVEGCISSRRVMVLVVRFCVSGRVQESSSSFGVGHVIVLGYRKMLIEHWTGVWMDSYRLWVMCQRLRM